jgi:uncharacterized protein YndB with AHSA1/START domain
VSALSPRAPSARSLVMRAEAEIAASADDVWRVLVDLPAYAAWNPWLVSAEGDVAPGGVVWASVVLGEKTMRAKHRVLVVEPGLRLCWRDAGWNALVVYGQRSRTIEPCARGVRLQQELLIDGPLRGLAMRLYGDALRDGLSAETQALKRRLEA